MSNVSHKSYKYQDDTFYDSLNSSDYEKLPLKEQMKKKMMLVESLFGASKLLPMIENPTPKGYRHKAVLSATNLKLEKSYQIRLGLFIEGSKVIKPKLGHFLHHPGIDAIFETLEKLLIKFKIRAYHEASGDGILKHVLIRKSYSNNQYMVVLVTQGNLFPNHKIFVRELIELHPEISTIVQNIHHKNTHLVLLEQEKILYGPGYIEDQIDDLVFRISSRSFYQVNPKQMMNLYHKALEFAEIKQNDVVLDCYSGIGTLTLLSAKKAKKAIGFEINEASVLNAITNKKINKVENAFFHQGDVQDLMNEMNEKVDVLLMDPTREGASLEFIQSVLKLAPKRIIYISCEPKTQIRDIKQLSQKYEVKKIQPIDMFSYTAHVENIVLLSLRTA